MKYVIICVCAFFLVWAWKIHIYLKRQRKAQADKRPFLRWPASVHQEAEQLKRLNQARNEDCIMEPVGTRGKFYRIKFSSDSDFVNCAVGMCQCPEYKRTHKPCKHIYKIASERGLI